MLLVTYSEFGRRVEENGNNGTDHGTASCLFCIGGSVKAGIYGSTPKLEDLEKENLLHETDFRQIYAAIEKDWFKLQQPILSKKYQPLNIIRQT